MTSHHFSHEKSDSFGNDKKKQVCYGASKLFLTGKKTKTVDADQANIPVNFNSKKFSVKFVGFPNGT